jgi:hypothetical protein
LAAAAGLLVIFALQYPLATTFPIGGDAAAHLRVAQLLRAFTTAPHDAWLALRDSTYPLAQLLFAGFGILPVSQPDIFIWWMTLAHVLSGAALGLLLWRLGSWRAAAAGIAIWALTPVGTNTHFEDGTAPQLVSLIFLLLALERMLAGATWSTLLLLAATAAAHPLSGFMLAASLITGVVIVYPIRRRISPHEARLVRYISVLIAVFALVVAVRLASGVDWPQVQSESYFYVLDALRSRFAPWIVLSIPGLALVTNRLRRRLFASASLLSFFWLSFLLTTNSNLAVGLWENRFRTYFILSVTIAAGLALPRLLASAFRHPLSRSLCALLLFTSLASLTWRDNSSVYAFYENPKNHARLHPDVAAAFTWMKDNLPPDSFIASTAATRHTDWIPILAARTWQEVNASHDLLTKKETELIAAAVASPFSHIVFLTDHEGIPEGLAARPDTFPIVFANDTAIIFQLP